MRDVAFGLSVLICDADVAHIFFEAVNKFRSRFFAELSDHASHGFGKLPLFRFLYHVYALVFAKGTLFNTFDCAERHSGFLKQPLPTFPLFLSLLFQAVKIAVYFVIDLNIPPPPMYVILEFGYFKCFSVYHFQHNWLQLLQSFRLFALAHSCRHATN